MSPPTGLGASDAEGELFFQVRKWTESSGLGRAYPPTAGITLPDSSIRSADATYVNYETLAKLTSEQKRAAFVQLIPDVVFELVSPSDDISAVHAKVDAYIENGVPPALLLDPSTHMVTLVRERDRPTCKTDLVEIGAEMPGFILDAGAIFRIATMRG